MKKIICLLILLGTLLLPSQVIATEEYNILNLPTTPINNQTSIKIAIIDSGIINNELFYPYVSQGYNFLDNNEDYTDTYGHGTKVTSILANLAKETGFNMQLIPLRVSDTNGMILVENIVNAIDYAITQRVDVINISLGINAMCPDLQTAIQNAQENNIIVVAGAGNNGENIYTYPASHDNVLSVGSIDMNQVKSEFSNYNDRISVVAPGENINVMELDGSYKPYKGTSLPTSFTTFEVALIKASYPALNNNEIMQIIKETAIDIGEVGRDDYYGYGVINYNNALINAYNSLEKYTDWKTQSNVTLDKQWNITFNKHIKSVGNVCIIDEYYNIFPTNIEIVENKIIVTPLSKYEKNTIYSLIIKDTVSYNDNMLKNDIRMKFKTVDNNINDTNVLRQQDVLEEIQEEILIMPTLEY